MDGEKLNVTQIHRVDVLAVWTAWHDKKISTRINHKEKISQFPSYYWNPNVC